MPFRDAAFDGAYSTWSYFFPGFHDISQGLGEVARVTRSGSPTVIADNAGDDAFTAMAPHDTATDVSFWRDVGFTVEIVETAFVFDSMDDAQRLLTFYFGELAEPALEIEYRVAVMVRY
jgi:ubiquinone/menaquinone biosynthesis C-methylase UbiE